MAEPKRKYVPGRAIQRVRISARDRDTIDPSHVLWLRVSIENALGAALGESVFSREDWDLLRGTFNVLEALDTLTLKGRYFMQVRGAQDALKRINQRFNKWGKWDFTSSDLESIRVAVAIYHVVILEITYNNLASACAYVEKQAAKHAKEQK